MLPPPPRTRWRARLCAAALMALLVPPAEAGPLGLPVPNPGPVLRNTVEKVRDTTNTLKDTVVDTLSGTVNETLGTLNLDPAGRPIDPAAFEQDENGARVVRGVVIALALSDRGREAAKALDIAVARTEDLDPLGLEVTKLEVPPGMPATEALAALKTADPEGVYDFEHIYDPSGQASASPAAAIMLSRIPHDDIDIGMIDAGIERKHPAFETADIVVRTTTARRRDSIPTAHGTAVASLLVGDDGGFRGALPGATLYAADAFAGSPTGGSAGDIARALAWLADEDVPVINVSITGPNNALLEAAVRAAIKRGHVLVAPVGNDGPAAGIKFPAAYDGVVAVTSVDAQGRVQIDANRGAALAFAAPGVDIRAAQLKGKYGAVTGTSFASPLVAARFAELVPRPDVASAVAARAALAAAALRAPKQLGPVMGHGILMPPVEMSSAAPPAR